jgi:hypothetical protein
VTLSCILTEFFSCFFRAIFVHGFAVDAVGCKMSKSLGNVVDPLAITHGGKDKKQEPAYGIDTLRYGLISMGLSIVGCVCSFRCLSSRTPLFSLLTDCLLWHSLKM